MKEKLNENIINHLMQHEEYITADSLAKSLNVNEKTIRRRIKQINNGKLDNIGKIESKRGEGYRLIIFDKDEFSKYYDYYIAEVQINNPLNRRTSIFNYVFENIEVSIDELLDNFYISETTLNNDIKELNTYSSHVGVKIIMNNNKNYCIVGSEYHIRNILLKLIYDSAMVRVRRRDTRKIKRKYVKVIQNVFYKEGFYVNKHSLDAIVNYIIISVSAINFKRVLIDTISRDEVNEKLLDIAFKLHNSITNEFETLFPYNETIFLSVFLKSVLPLEMININVDNDITYHTALAYVVIVKGVINSLGFNQISQQCEEDIIKFIYSLILRVRFDIQKREMIYLDIEKTHAQAYCISKIIIKQIEKEAKISISREEVAYFSLIINNYYFLSKEVKKKVLAILPADYTVARIFKRELKHFSLYEVEIIDYEYFLKNKDTLEGVYSLVINPFGDMVSLDNVKIYNIFDIVTRTDFNVISRILSCNNYNQLLNNLSIMEDINDFDNLDNLKKHFDTTGYYTTFFGSYICFSKENVKTMNYRVYEENNKRVLLFIINNTLHQGQMFDLLKVALDTIIKLNTGKGVLDREKLIEYYSK